MRQETDALLGLMSMLADKAEPPAVVRPVDNPQHLPVADVTCSRRGARSPQLRLTCCDGCYAAFISREFLRIRRTVCENPAACVDRAGGGEPCSLLKRVFFFLKGAHGDVGRRCSHRARGSLRPLAPPGGVS